MYQPTNSPEIIGHNDYMLPEILLKLPLQSLISFKLVSKQWLSLISDNHFLLRYTNLHPPSLSGLFLVPQQRNKDNRNQIEYIPFNESRSEAAPCNGLLLTCHGRKHYVFNPTTEKSKLVPTCPDQFVNKHGVEVVFPRTVASYYSLAFDPELSPHYKIICIKKSGNTFNIAIYSSDTAIWRLTKSPEFPAPQDIDFSKAIYCNGAVHWTKRTPRGLYIDIDNELVNYMPELPRKEQYSCEYFGHSRGRLCCVFTMEGLHYYEIFEMETDYSTWVLKGRVELDALAFKFPKMEINYWNAHFKYQCHVLSVVHSNNGKVPKVILSIPDEIIAHNCKKKTTSKIHDSRLSTQDRRLWYNVYCVHDYFESLYPL
ncbi:hypothetical protein RND81_13G029100 [Saponaria officinalis]|uniref:F-box domain-containing protein n=1 Tax=Saponaria officinalis TaxID=3572 RepID=A0AAW1GWV9_SAPOF